MPRCFLIAICLVLSTFALSQGPAPTPVSAAEVPNKPAVLPRAEEMRLALSAAPEYLRDKAGVYLLEEQGYVKERESQNGFTCIVNRDHPLNIKPTCYDAEGTATILPKVLYFGEEMMKGKPVEEIRKEVVEGFKSGRFISPRRAGVAYMLSGDIKNYSPQMGHTMSFPGHVMFYAPNLTDADIGSDGSFSPGMPSIAYQGPHGFMVVVMPEAPKADAGGEEHKGH